MRRHDAHECAHEEIVLGEEHEGSEFLRPGMHVLLPCSECGETPRDLLEVTTAKLIEHDEAFAATHPDMQLFHWSPSVNRAGIVRRGLVPGRRPATHPDVPSLTELGFDVSDGWRAPYVCFADSPSWAWALSAGQRSAPAVSWDCWQTSLGDLTSPAIESSVDRPSGLHEARTAYRVPKSRLWLVGSRVKEPTAHPRSTPAYERTPA